MSYFKGIKLKNVTIKSVDSDYLSNFDAFIRAGEIIAIIGPSGSGKSALLHMIAGSDIFTGEKTCYGSVEIVYGKNEIKNRCPKCWYRKIRLVPHKDMFVPSLDCNQTLQHYRQLNDVITSISNNLVSEKTMVGELQSKQNIESKTSLKKLSILCALSSDPAVILIDEPFFLLEQKGISEIKNILQQYARNSKEFDWKCKSCKMSTIAGKKCAVFALNSTNLAIEMDDYLSLIDRIILLSKSKQMVFFGTIDEAMRELGLESREELIRYIEDFESSPEHLIESSKLIKTRVLASKTSGNLKSISILFQRHFLQIRNSPKQYLRIIIERIIIFTLLSFIFQNTKSRSALIGLYFFLPINQTANVILFTSSESFCTGELDILERDRFHQIYRSWNVLAVKFVVMSVVNLLPALVYLPVIFFVSAIQNISSFPLFMLANALNIICSVSVGLLIATSSKDIFIRNLWLFGLSTLIATFGGIHTAANYQLHWIIRWIQYISPTYYIFLILIQLEFNDYEIRNVLSLGSFILNIGAGFAALAGLTLLYFILASIGIFNSTLPKRILF